MAHPIRDAIEALESALESVTDARGETDADTAQFDALDAIVDSTAEALADARKSLVGSDCPRDWLLNEAGEDYDTVEAESAEEALAVARDNVDRSNYSDAEGTLWIDISVRCEESGEESSDTVTLDAEEPECSHADGHEWSDAHELVGGIESNPGVYAHDGGVYIHEACLHCGCRRTTDTWAQRPDTGEQGLTSVKYEEGYYDVSAYQARDFEAEVKHIGCSEARAAAAWVLRGVRAILDGEDYDVPASVDHAVRIQRVLDYLYRVDRAVPSGRERRAVLLALRFAVDGDDEARIAHAVLAAMAPRMAVAA